MIGDEAACQRVIADGADKPLIGFRQAGKATTELSLIFDADKKARKA
ncbi:MAG: hypothetical protein LZF61_05935 [Nitrosomonas sp.]|nr:MAG: hypothetical protein LZF61_05935 [Nitrosomonas sp.]